MLMENDTAIAYNSIEFDSNNEVCVTGDTACEIYTIHGVKKFYHTFDNKLYKVMYKSGMNNYIFIYRRRNGRGETEMNWLLIAVICIIAWNVVRGYTRGVLRMVYSLAAWIVMLAASTMAAPYVRDQILSQTGIEPVIFKRY